MKTSAQEILQLGARTDFWGLITVGIDEMIEDIEHEFEERDMKGLPAEQYKLETEIKIAKIKFLKNLRELPRELILKMQNPADEVKNFDPYRTARDFDK